MRNQMPKIYALIFVLLLVMIVTGCGGSLLQLKRSKKPDDEISKAIDEAVGRKKVHYHGKEYCNSDEVVWYEYTVYDYEDENLLTDMVEAANAAIEEKETTENIHLEIREEMPGGIEGVASLCNYYENEDGYIKYNFLQNLYIRGTKRSNRGERSPYNKASTYINLPDIKRLVVTEKIAQNAEDEEVDWYEIWPDLEYYEVLEN